MAEAIFSGMLKKNTKNKDILIFDIDKDRTSYLEKKYSFKVASDVDELISLSDIVILAIKPQIIESVLPKISKKYINEQIFISIAAGITLDMIKGYLKTDRLVRVMPNTPALIGKGVSALCLLDKVFFKEEEIKDIESIFSSIGEYIWLEENKFNAVTAISGSGPAYVYRFIDSFIDSGVFVGLSRDLARKLVIETILGATLMVKESKEEPKVLEGKVTSPGGTTIHGLTAMEKGNFSNSINDGVKAAYKRAEELGKNKK